MAIPLMAIEQFFAYDWAFIVLKYRFNRVQTLIAQFWETQVVPIVSPNLHNVNSFNLQVSTPTLALDPMNYSKNDE